MIVETREEKTLRSLEQDPISTEVKHGTKAAACGERGKEVNDLSYNFAEQEKNYGKRQALLCPVRQSYDDRS